MSDFYIILLFTEFRVREISICRSHILYSLLTIFNYNISQLSQFHSVIKEDDSSCIRQWVIKTPQDSVCIQTYSNFDQKKATELRHSFRSSPCWETLFCGCLLLLHVLLSRPRKQGPDHALPGPFLRIMFAESNREGWSNVSLQEKEQACHKRGRFPKLSVTQLWRNPTACTSGPPCCTLGTWEIKETGINHKPHVALRWVIKLFVSDLGVCVFCQPPQNSHRITYYLVK